MAKYRVDVLNDLQESQQTLEIDNVEELASQLPEGWTVEVIDEAECKCPVCKDWTLMLINGKCLECHEDALPYPTGRGEEYAGERWEED